MYVTTFYSFKGGVGRSMALANAAIELVKLGRRVLVVDFDLEAPGLDTFDILRPPDGTPGIIDFVHDYLDSNRAPDACRYLSRLSGVSEGNGELWIMPSGDQEVTYAARFSAIDWVELYEKRDGYLLIEDLKRQWKQSIDPDYVLIDSRTGHTDTSGICTRQLPDAVAILFFPNEQNLRGLKKVVRDIRTEANGSHRKEIDLHFVMSNVPDLDDEDRILERKITAFGNELAFRRRPLVVHRYDSLSLLNQVIFTRDRPRSRLAQEYRDIVREIVGRNLADRDGALDYIRRARRHWRHRGVQDDSPEKINRKLNKIEEVHSGDGEVLHALGTFLEDDRQTERAASLFDRAIDAGYDDPEVRLRRARVRVDRDDLAGAREDALQVLSCEGLPPPLVRDAVQLAMPEVSGNITSSKAVASLDIDERIWLAMGLNRSLDEMRVAVSILRLLVGNEDLATQERSSANNELALCYIGIREYGAAADLLLREERDIKRMDIQVAFNYGVAIWAKTGRVAPEPFARVVELDQQQDDTSLKDDPNYLQCMAVACWAVGESVRALKFESRARDAILKRRAPVFSCWRYRKTSAKEFEADLDEIRALIGGDTFRKPRFMAREDEEEADQQDVK